MGPNQTYKLFTQQRKPSENKNKQDQEKSKGNVTIGALSPKNMDLPEAKVVDL